MSTLLLRLAAPLQSWGSDAKFEKRGTERIPTKSGVVGLIAAALGRERYESVEDLVRLRFGVRVEREGQLLRDFHTAKPVGKKDPYVTHRYYLSDAVFLAGLEGDREELDSIHEALCNPVFPLYLGRRSCPPEGRVSLGIRAGKSLEVALKEEPRLVNDHVTHIRFVYDTGPGDSFSYMLRDQPISFNPEHRIHGFRRISEKVLVIDSAKFQEQNEPVTDHDPFSQMGG